MSCLPNSSTAEDMPPSRASVRAEESVMAHPVPSLSIVTVTGKLEVDSFSLMDSRSREALFLLTA